MVSAEIVKWNAIQDQFRDGLVLGNGASIAIHQGFKYESLYKEAQQRKFLDENAIAIFEAFGKNQHDFELVLRRLWYARQVNQALNLSGDAVDLVDNAYQTIRNALIRIVRATHVTYDDASQYFEPIAQFVSHFRTVFSLNYDLILYWAAMYGNTAKIGKFRDCFHYVTSGNLVLDPSWGTYRDGDGATLFFYPHGYLALARDVSDEEHKLRASSTKLLDAILTSWEDGKVLPVFVCEGTSDHKLRSINGSSYLGRVYLNGFEEIQESVVIYGWSMGEQEQHIVDQILSQQPKAVAVSVWNGNMDTVGRANQLFAGKVERLVFFDAQSPGAWNNPNGSKEPIVAGTNLNVFARPAAIQG